MIKINHNWLSILTATLLVGCGGSKTNSTTSNSPNQNASNTPDTTLAECQSMQLARSENESYKLNYISPNRSDDESEDKDDRKKDDNNDGNSKRDEENEGDEGDESSSTGIHNQGKVCLKCHSFDSGATVFTSLTAPNNSSGAVGYKIQLNNAYVYNTGRGSGNSNLVSYSGGKFTANVIDNNGNIVNSSADMSHDASRLDCNRCHTATGNNGAPGRIINKHFIPSSVSDTSTATTTCVSFDKHIMPILISHCKSCHGSNGRFSIGSTAATYNNISSLKSAILPSVKYLLDKASNTLSHGGGRVLPSNSNTYQTIQSWINEGALNN